MLGKKKLYLPVSDVLFREEKEPVATLALIPTSAEGPLVQTNWTTFRPVSAVSVWIEYGLGASSLILMVSTVLFALVWAPRKFLGKLREAPRLSIRVIPLLSVLCFGGAIGLFLLSNDDLLQRFGNLTIWSGGFHALTVAFALTAVIGLAITLRARNAGVRRWVYTHALAVSLANTMVAAYLAYWGVIGYRPWA